MSFNMNMVAHMRAISDCLPKFHARTELKFGNFLLEVRARGRYYELIPQYAILQGSRVIYTPALKSDVTHFIGWRPYFNRQWDLSNDKLAFKQYCRNNGLRVPRLFMQPADVVSDVIIKRRRSSFGEGIEGPFRREEANAMQRTLADGMYFEEFVIGEIAKIWYWDEKPVCVETKRMVPLAGDGDKTLRELVNAAKSSFVPVEWEPVEAMARYQGVSLDTVIPTDHVVLSDFRYLSSLHPSTLHNGNIIHKLRGTPALEQMEKAGPVFWRGIPAEIRQHTLYTIDAIIDPSQQVWFLEMNSNPVVHPDSYMAMFEGLFGPAQAPAAPSAQSAVLMPPVPTPPAKASGG